MAKIHEALDPTTVRALWDDINKLSLQVSQLRDTFVRLIDPPTQAADDYEDDDEPLLKPAHKR